MPLFFDRSIEGRHIKLGVNGWHKVDDIDKYSKNAQGKLVVHKKGNKQLIIEDSVAAAVEAVLKKEGKNI